MRYIHADTEKAYIIVNALNNCVYDNTDDAHDCDRKGIFDASQSAQKETNKFVSYKNVKGTLNYEDTVSGR